MESFQRKVFSSAHLIFYPTFVDFLKGYLPGSVNSVYEPYISVEQVFSHNIALLYVSPQSYSKVMSKYGIQYLNA